MVAAALCPLDVERTGDDVLVYAMAYASTRDQIQASLIDGYRSGAFGLTVPPLVLPQFKLDAAQLKNAMMSVDDLRVFAADCGVEVNAPAQSPATPAPVTGKRWTPEKLAELKAYREVHTMPETAVKFGISEQRIRQLQPSKKPKAKPFAGLIHRMK